MRAYLSPLSPSTSQFSSAQSWYGIAARDAKLTIARSPMRWRRWWTGCVTTVHSGATGLTVLKHSWKGWNNEQASREYSYPCDREGIPASARKALARAHREPAHRAMADEK